MRARALPFGLVAVAGLVAAACAGAPPPAPRPRAKPAPSAAPAGPATLPATRLAELPGGTFGPYVGRSGRAAVAVWAAPGPPAAEGAPSAPGQWFSAPLGGPGAEAPTPLALGAAPAELGVVTVASLVRPPSPAPAGARGFAVLAAERHDAGERVSALLLGEGGELRAGPLVLGESAHAVMWLEAFATAAGTLALWAEHHGLHAELMTARLGREGEFLRRSALTAPPAAGAAEGAPLRLRAWQAVPFGNGVALLTVPAPPGPREDGTDAPAPAPGGVAARGAVGAPVVPPPRPTVELLQLDAEGAVAPTRLALSTDGGVDAEVELVATRGGLLAAWVDRSLLDARVMVAALDASGRLRRPPAPVTTARGDEALVGLGGAVDGSGAILAVQRVGGGEATMALVRLSDEGQVAAAEVGVRLPQPDLIPGVVALPGGDGAALLTLAPACPRGGPCGEAELHFLQLDAALAPRATEPLRLGALGGQAATLGWALGCDAQGCSALAAPDGSPAPVFHVHLARASDHWQAPMVVPSEARPRLRELSTLAEGAPLAEVTALTLGGERGGTGGGSPAATRTWVAALTEATLPEVRPGARPLPPAGTLTLRALTAPGEAAEGAAMAPAGLIITQRARVEGGVALAPGAPGAGDVLVVWSAVEAGQPQVFATHVDARGQKLLQRMVRRASGAVSDVAATAVPEGWVLAWVDERDGDPEVYAARLDRKLNRIGLDQRVTRRAGLASGPALLARAGDVLVAWSDEADAPSPGVADIWTARLALRDARPLGAPARLLSSAEHSLSVVLAPRGVGGLAAWVEQPTAGAEAVVRLAELDEAGAVLGGSHRVEVGAPASSLALACAAPGVAAGAAAGCRVVLAVEGAERAVLQGFVWSPGAEVTPTELFAIPGPPAQPVTPTLTGDAVVFADRRSPRRARVRRMSVHW